MFEGREIMVCFSSGYTKWATIGLVSARFNQTLG